MGYCENHDFGREVPINDAERKLLKGVFSKVSEVDGPSPWRLSDSFSRLLEGGFEVERGDEAAVSVPGQ